MDLKNLIKYTHDLSVLYVEDKIEVREYVVTILKDIFFKVDSFKDAQQALGAYEKFYTLNNRYYDLVLTDLVMPDMDGIELCHRILKINQQQYIIPISAYSEKERLQELMSLGVDDFIQKPLKIENLLQMIEKYSKLNNKRIEKNETFQKMNCDIQSILEIIAHVSIISKADSNGYITYANNQFYELSKYSKDELTKNKHKLFEQEHMSSTAFEKIWEVLKKGNIWRGKIKNSSKEGGFFITNSSIIPLFNQNMDISEYVKIDFLENKNDIKHENLENVYKVYKQNFNKNVQFLTQKNEKLYSEKKLCEEKIDFLLKKIDTLEHENYQLKVK